jgi:hypothetical protein
MIVREADTTCLKAGAWLRSEGGVCPPGHRRPPPAGTDGPALETIVKEILTGQSP